MRRLAAAVAAVAVLAGCGSADPVPATPADPAAELRAASNRLAEMPVRMEMTTDAVPMASGAMDARNNLGEFITHFQPGEAKSSLRIGSDLYLQMGGLPGVPAGTWMHVDANSLGPDSPLQLHNQGPAATTRLLDTSTDVTRTGPSSFRGTLDMSALPQGRPAAGGKIGAAPFTAQVDTAGNLTEIVIDSGTWQVTVTYSEHGVPLKLTAPPEDKVVPMPDDVRPFFD